GNFHNPSHPLNLPPLRPILVCLPFGLRRAKGQACHPDLQWLNLRRESPGQVPAVLVLLPHPVPDRNLRESPRHCENRLKAY
ncbi:unnamed protein product, partial [Linum tenue]